MIYLAMVLEDGETYSNLKGCKIVCVNDTDAFQTDDINEVIKEIAQVGENALGYIVTEFK